jgi:hypothetical protein
MSQPHFWKSVKMALTLLKWRLESPLRLSKLQSSIAEVKTPRIEVFFISLESYRSVDVENGLAWVIWTYATRYGNVKNWLNVENRLDPNKFALDFIPIGGLSKELWHHKVPKVQIGTVLGLLLGRPRTKSHSNIGDVERRRKYYMGEGGSFPRVQAMVSLVSLGSPVACPSSKGALKSELTNLLVGWMQIQTSN